MKKFVFTLTAVYDVALSTEKQQKAQLKKLTEKLEQLQAQLAAAQGELASGRQKCADKMRSGIGSDELAAYSQYFEGMANVITKLNNSISFTRAERDKLTAEYIKTRNKIKALDRMREAQMEEYQMELKKEQDNEIGDILSFRIAVGERA